MIRSFLAAAVAAASLVVATAPAGAATTYVDNPITGFTDVYDVSSDGWVVGAQWVGAPTKTPRPVGVHQTDLSKVKQAWMTGAGRAAAYQRMLVETPDQQLAMVHLVTGAVKVVPLPADADPDVDEIEVVDLDDDQSFLLRATSAQYKARAWLAEPWGTGWTFEKLPDGFTPVDMNDDRVVAGYVWHDTFPVASVWQGGTPQPIGNPSTRAVAINDKGKVVVVAEDSSIDAFVHDLATGTIAALPSGPGRYHVIGPESINENGDVVVTNFADGCTMGKNALGDEACVGTSIGVVRISTGTYTKVAEVPKGRYETPAGITAAGHVVTRRIPDGLPTGASESHLYRKTIV
jgi:hypothetical protein